MISITKILNDDKFNTIFSILLGIGIICVIRPMCSGNNCDVLKPPISSEFDNYVYKLGKKCYEFKTEIVNCPESGTIEAFKECNSKITKNSENDNKDDSFIRRKSPIIRCE